MPRIDRPVATVFHSQVDPEVERAPFQGEEIDTLPGALGLAVSHDQARIGATAIRLLQRVLGDLGLTVALDGLLGPETLEASEAAWPTGDRYLVDCYGLALRTDLYHAAFADPALRPKVAARDGTKGSWLREAEASISPAYRLTIREHAEWVASWT